jgi:hypothetical protein
MISINHFFLRQVLIAFVEISNLSGVIYFGLRQHITRAILSWRSYFSKYVLFFSIDINILYSFYRRVRVVHTLWEGNVYADYLAKIGTRNPEG